MTGSYQPRRAAIIMALLTWLIKYQFHWDDLMLSLMGGTGTISPILSMHLQEKGTWLGIQLSPKMGNSENAA